MSKEGPKFIGNEELYPFHTYMWKDEMVQLSRSVMVGDHQLNGHEFEESPGVGDGQGRLACCSPWGRKKRDMTERLN